VLRLYPTFTRLSMDQLVYERHGIYGKDYAADIALYASYQDEAEQGLMAAFRTLLRNKRDVVLDRSFWCKADRDEVKAIIEEAGARPVLVVLRARDSEVLWRRIQERRAKEVNADSALVITKELLAQYVKGFEWPEGEGEIVIYVD
jgi:predicted kinase